MNRSTLPLQTAASEAAVRWRIAGPDRVSTRDRVARAIADIETSPEAEVWLDGEWVDESDLQAMWRAMQNQQSPTSQAHVFEWDGDVLRCAACHHLPAHCQGAAS